MTSQSPAEVLAHVARESEWRLKAIHSLTTELVALRQLHNSVALPNRLPTELLCEVFKHLVDRRGHVVHIVNATHVCKRWRDIALSVPWLWTCFAIDRVDVVAAFLERSKDKPIMLYLTNPRQPMHLIARLIAAHLHRIRALRARCPPDQGVERLLGRLNSPAPMLEELIIEKRLKPGIEGPDVSLASIARLFGGSFPSPSLRKLCIRNVAMFPRAVGPCSLVTLDIVQNTARGMPSLYCLLQFLGQCPMLEQLRIAGLSRQSHAEFSELVVNLPRLIHLRINSSEELMCGLLNCISVPKTTSIRLQAPYTGNGYDMIPPSAETGLQCLANIRRLEFMFDDDKFVLRVFHTVEGTPEPAFELQLMICSRFRVELSDLMSPWPFNLSQVQSVVISGPPPRMARVAEVGHGLSHLPNLTSLRVVSMGGNALRDVLYYLRLERNAASEEGSVESLEPLLCPKLAALELCDIPDGEVIKEPLFGTIAVRTRTGVLKELNLFLVQGLSKEEVLGMEAVAAGAVALCLDTGEEWVSREAVVSA